MNWADYKLKHPLTRQLYKQADVEKIREHAFRHGSPVVKDTRSNQQNRYYWGVVLKTIGDVLGYEPEEVHQIFAEMFLTYEKDKRTFVRSTTQLKTDEMADYTDRVVRFAATDLSIYVPKPNE